VARALAGIASPVKRHKFMAVGLAANFGVRNVVRTENNHFPYS
jgi:hypothetical protein